MNAHFESKHKIEISPGELVQVLGSVYNKCDLHLTSACRKKATSKSICATNKLATSKSWPVMADDTVASLLVRWLADVPVRSYKKVAQGLGLSRNLKASVLQLDVDTCLRLNTLRAMLDGVEVLEFVSPESIADFTNFLKGVRGPVLDSLEAENYDPAFVVYGGEEFPGVSYMADRKIKVSVHRVREIEVECW